MVSDLQTSMRDTDVSETDVSETIILTETARVTRAQAAWCLISTASHSFPGRLGGRSDSESDLHEI